jgi:hypothetical protein
MLQHLGFTLIKSAASMSIFITHVYQDLIEPAVIQVLAGLGMTPIAPAMTPPRPPTYLPVMLDGKLIGHVRSLSAPALVSRLRDIKAAKLAEEESSPVGATTIMLDVSHAWSQLTWLHHVGYVCDRHIACKSVYSRERQDTCLITCVISFWIANELVHVIKEVPRRSLTGILSGTVCAGPKSLHSF